MENTFEKILKDGERKGYFRVFNDGAKIEYLPSGHKENLNDPEEIVIGSIVGLIKNKKNKSL